MNMITQTMIQTISLIVSLFVSLILLWTLLEMKNQRRSMYMPDLYVQNQSFKIETKKNRDFSWKYNNRSSSNFSLTISNIGLGTAKNIEIKWFYELSKLLNIIKKLDKNKLFEIREEGDFIRIEENKSNRLINLKCRSYNEIFLRTNEKMYIDVPLAFKELFSMIIYLAVNSDLKISCEYIKKIPNPVIKISYEDIGKNKITKTVSLDINTNMFSKSSQKIKQIRYEGTIEPKEIRGGRLRNTLSILRSSISSRKNT